MLLPARLTVAALAVSMLAAPVAADAKAKRQKPPKKAVVAKLLHEAYCGPVTALNGNTIATSTITITSLNRGRARRGHWWRDGTPANRRTKVFPVRASYVCDYSATADANPGATFDDWQIKGDYVFFRDEFGTWTHRNSGNERRRIEQ